MGLGLLGRGLGDAVFLAEHGAELIVTDLRNAKILAPSLAKLKRFKNIQYTLGQHNLEDFRNRDFILKAAGVPLDSPFIAEARKHDVPIEMDASLFAELMPKGVTLVGVTGTRGKSTVTALIYEILQGSTLVGKKVEPCRIYKAGNLVPEATLPLLKKVKVGDVVVLELDSWQLQGFHDAKISPQVAVFTTFLDDHLIYYKGDKKKYLEDKTAIFKYQKNGDILVMGKQAAPFISSHNKVVARSVEIPKEWKVKLLGEHNRENIACALAATRALGVSDSVMKKVIACFKGVSGRLEYLRVVRGVKIYNDNNATTPDATIAALRALSPLNSSFPKGGARVGEGGGFENPSTRKNSVLPLRKGELKKNIILIMGGTDKGLDMSKLMDEIPKYCKGLVLLKESGTEKFLTLIHNSKFIIQEMVEAENLEECVEKAMRMAQKGDIVLFSPAFASFGKWFKNEYDRGEQFVEIVESL